MAERITGVDRWQSWLLVGLAFAVPVLVHRGALNAFQPVKFAAIVVVATVLLPLAVARVVGRDESPAAFRTPVILASALAAAVLIASVASGSFVESAVGALGRYVGAVVYVSYAIIFVSVTMLSSRRSDVLLVRALVLAGLVVGGYGILQAVGADPVEWVDFELQGSFSTVGNPNFAAGFAAIAGVLSAMVALNSRESTPWRVVAGIAFLVAIGQAWASEGVQGWVALGAGLLVFGALSALYRLRLGERIPSGRGPRTLITGGFAGVMLAAAAGVVWVASRADVLGERFYIYEAAVRAWRADPILGLGFAGFGDVFARYRAPEHAVAYGYTTTDTAHSVPLEMLVAGGIVLGLIYLAFVGYVGLRAIAAAAVTEDGAQRLMLAGLTGAWVAYQAQSLISIDVPALGVSHFILAALVIRASVGPSQTGWVASKRRPSATSLRVAAAAAGIAAVLALWLGSIPLRADLAAADGIRQLNAGDTSGVASLSDATELMPWAPMYRFLLAGGLERAGRQAEAVEALERAAELGEGSSSFALARARAAQTLGNPEVALRWYLAGVERDPNNPALLVEAGKYAIAHGERPTGQELLERALVLNPSDADARAALNG